MNEELKVRLFERIDDGWYLSSELFGDKGADIYDFQIENYIHFLANVESREDLIRGIRELNPLLELDGTLEVAENMTDEEFSRFKELLKLERCQEESKMSKKYYNLLLPKIFIIALPLAEKTEVPLGTALIRVLEAN